MKQNTVSNSCHAENKCTLEKNWRVSFSRTGECSRRQANSRKSGGTHQYSFSNKVFNILNMGHHFTSRLKMNWRKYKQKISGKLYSEHNDLRTHLVAIYPKHKCLYRWDSSMFYNQYKYCWRNESLTCNTEYIKRIKG